MIAWPDDWQEEARAAVLPYFGTDDRLELVVGPPATSLFGSVFAGHVYLDGDRPMIVHDRSGRADVYPWELPAGPVLRAYLLRPRRPRLTLYALEGWQPKN